MIYSGSRYANGQVVVQPDNTVAVRRRFSTPSKRFWLYTWKSTDRLDVIASRYLKGPQNWWQILDANPLIQNPTDIRPGQQIRIPR